MNIKMDTGFLKHIVATALLAMALLGGQFASGQCPLHLSSADKHATVDVEAMRADIVRLHIKLDEHSSPRTLVMDPALQAVPLADVSCSANELHSPQMSLSLRRGQTNKEASQEIQVKGPQGEALLSFEDPTVDAGKGTIAMTHDPSEDLYGMRGTELADSKKGILRNHGEKVIMGLQGDSGAPFFFTDHYGVLIDSDGGDFETHGDRIVFQKSSRADIELFVIVGPPEETMAAVALLTGRPPMPPRWALGFLNSQWVIDQAELYKLADSYREKNVPISGFILDFDWKAWGEDNYGEWRWNSTAGPGNSSPDKFPDGASGKVAAKMESQGIHLAGILKPRILIDNSNGKPTEASSYATAHGFWYPNHKFADDYFTNRLSGDLDFAKPEVRAWFWQHLLPSFRAGMKGWWNDEADYSPELTHDNFQFLNMARALYEGQRAASDEREWSLNRATYLGSARYGSILWSGDLYTGFDSMAYQRERMIAALNTGQPYWSMDGGGFHGHPTPENYARWVEFAAFVPIFRVHGDAGEKRQPWVYGPTAEAAAEHAMRLRYDLMPYIYSNAHLSNQTGIGIFRPLFWEFPNDPKTATETRSWMFGDALLVSPIVTEGETAHLIYLPKGNWIDYWSGATLEGGREVTVKVDAKLWSDIPIFVREGSIVATSPRQTGNELAPGPSLTLDVYPSAAREAVFGVYDDDGVSYAYEKGVFFEQRLSARQESRNIVLSLAAPAGSFHTPTSRYVFRIHQTTSGLSGPAKLKQFSSEKDFAASSVPGWIVVKNGAASTTLIRLPAGKQLEERLRLR